MKRGAKHLRAATPSGLSAAQILAVPFAILDASAPPNLEIAAARELAERIDTAIDAHAHQSARHQSALDLRARAFTLLARTYNQVRRAITYLCWDDDSERDRLAPSLHVLTNGRRR